MINHKKRKASFLKKYLIHLLSLFFFISFPLCSQVYAQGEFTFSIWNRSYFSDIEKENPYEYETNYHLDFAQFVPNYGKLWARLDWVQTKKDMRLGKGFIGLEGFRLGVFNISSTYGDSFLKFTNLEDRFSNTYYPYIYFRGGILNISSPHLNSSFFGGKVSTLKGLLGTTYDLTEEKFYGFKTRVQPIQIFSIGTGFIRTENEREPSGVLLTKNNNIFLIDSELNISKSYKFLGEYKISSYYRGNDSKRINDFFIKAGPIIRTEKFNLEANYRYVGTNYRFVSEFTQIERDQEGYFLLMEYKPWKYFSIMGNADRFKNNVQNNPSKDTIDTARGLMGFSFYSPSLPSISFRFSLTDRMSREDVTYPVDSASLGYFAQVSQRFKKLHFYFRYHRQETENRIFPSQDFNQNTATFGLRHYFKRGSMLWLEGEWMDKLDYQGREKSEDIKGRFGLNYYLSPNLYLYFVTTYTKSKEEMMSEKERLELYSTINFKLPWGIDLSCNLGADRYLSLPERDIRGTNYRITLRLTKRFRWGKSFPKTGAFPEMEPRGVGSIQGYVFDDLNQNGMKDPQEKGYPGIKVELEDGTVVETDSEGKYKFSNIGVGFHWVTFEKRKIPIELNILTPSKEQVEVRKWRTAKVNFRLVTSAFISGRLINDVNKNGKIDKGEKGIPDVLVWLKPVNKKLKIDTLNTYTDKEGNFAFEYITPGEYYLFVDKGNLPERSEFTSPSSIKINVLPGQMLKNQEFLIHIKPRPIIINQHEKN